MTDQRPRSVGSLPRAVSRMETLPSDAPARQLAGSASIPRPRSGSATSHYTVKPMPARRGVSGTAAMALSRTMPLGDAGAAPSRDASSRRTGGIASEVYKPIGLSLFTASAAARRAAAEAAEELGGETPAELSGVDQGAQEALVRGLREQLSQPPASRELEAAQGPAAKPPRRAAAPPGPPLSARGAAQAEAGAAEARRERARGGSAPAHVAGRAQLAASLGAAAACAHGSFASAAAALGRPPPAADPPAALPAWASAPASPEGSAMPDSLLERLLELDNAERRSDATMLAHPPSSLLLGAEFAAAREAEVERTRLELQAYLAQLRTSHVVELPPSHEAHVAERVKAALASGDRHSLDETDAADDADQAEADAPADAPADLPAESPSARASAGWIDRIEAAIDGADSPLLDALAEMRRLDALLRAKASKLRRVRSRGRAQAQGAQAEAVVEDGGRAARRGVGGESAGAAAAAPCAEERRQEQEAEKAELPARPHLAEHARTPPPLPIAERGGAAADGSAETTPRARGADGSPPSTAGSLALGAFVTATALLNKESGWASALPAEAAEQAELPPAARVLCEERAPELGARAEAAARGAAPRAEPGGDGGVLGGLTAGSLLACAAAELEAEGEAAHGTLFDSLAIPRLARREAREEATSLEEQAARLDPRIVRLSGAEAARLAQLEAMTEAQLLQPAAPEEARARLGAITHELCARFLGPATAPPKPEAGAQSLAERTAAALEAVAPVSRSTEPPRTADADGQRLTAHGFHDYAREQRAEREARDVLHSIDERLRALHGRPHPLAERSDEGGPCAVGPTDGADAADPISASERAQLQRLLAAVKELAQAELRASPEPTGHGAVASRAPLNILNVEEGRDERQAGTRCGELAGSSGVLRRAGAGQEPRSSESEADVLIVAHSL